MFELGKVVITSGISSKANKSHPFAYEVMNALTRYQKGDWGDLGAGDKELNNESVHNGLGNILAAYETSEGRIYIKTEYDHSMTTILFADEY